MPTNLYGVNDNFDLASSHVLRALMRKFHDARLRGDRDVTVWGSGNLRREFLHVDDLADACVFLMQRYDEPGHINVGTGEDLTIREPAELVRDIIYSEAVLLVDRSKPDGMSRKLPTRPKSAMQLLNTSKAGTVIDRVFLRGTNRAPGLWHGRPPRSTSAKIWSWPGVMK